MKKHVSILVLLFIGIIYPFSNARAQYPIPSFKVTLEQVNTTFEEDSENDLFSKTVSREERQLVIEVVDDIPSQLSWAIVVVYSIDGLDELGPYTTYEGFPLRVDIDEREWGINVTDFLEGCTVSTWIEE